MFEKILQFLNYPLLAAGCLVSPVIRLLFPGIRYGYDVSTFVEVGSYANHFNELYAGELFSNYPIIGLLASTGLLKLFDFDIGNYMIALSFLDMLNVFLVFFILKNLKVNYAGIWAFAIAVIPSTWAGAALWGQIDNVGQFLLLSLLLLTILFYKKEWFNKQLILFITLFGLVFSMAILTKQVLLFSLVPFSILFIHLLFIKTDYHLIKSLNCFLLFICFVLTPIIVFDWWLILPDKYPISHLQRVYLEGSEHMNKISGNGFNIWVLFFKDMLNTSSNLLLGFVSPKYIGIFLFLFSFAVITYLHLQKIRTQAIQLISKSFIVNYVLYLAIINLSFNVFLTGTHDRYLYHFYPFLFIAIIAMGQDFTSILKNKTLYISLVGAILYGAFILSILMMAQPAYSNKVLAVFHFCLFVYLFLQYFLKPQRTKNAN